MLFPSDSESYAHWSGLGSIDIPDLALDTNMTPPCRDLAGKYPEGFAVRTELEYAPASALPMKNMQTCGRTVIIGNLDDNAAPQTTLN
jgi:hypothetical protein